MCDTFVAINDRTFDGSVIFGKNSDREPNEAQSLEFHSGKHFHTGERVECTYLSIPQVEKTNSILISRPFWMWGAEMGINEFGVTIGNEAVFTKVPHKKGKALLGMDLLRLALERSNSAINALEVITELLAEFGQGGNAGYQEKLFYHNSFILADEKEAWVLETAGHLWAAKKVDDFYAISNGLTIGKEFDLSHPDLISFAQKEGWLKKGADFHFAFCYSDWFYTTFSRCKVRRERAYHLSNQKERIDVPKAFAHLRDHGTDNYKPDSHFFMNHICAHSANSLARNASQSVGSMVIHLKKGTYTAWATGTSAPCTSLFKPISLKNPGLPKCKIPGPTNDTESLWWQHEKLHRKILENYPERIGIIKQDQRVYEQDLIQAFQKSSEEVKKQISMEAFQRAEELTKKWLGQISARNDSLSAKWHFRKYWKKQNKKARIL